MSRRDQRRARRGPATSPPSLFGSPVAARPISGYALVPVRFFFGGTFLYAGIDKLLSPTFFDPTSPASIQAQLATFVRFSPIGGLVKLGQPFATPIGLAIALVEIAIGLGALAGLAFRVAAIAGAALSLLFFLTASWTTHPFYYGPDLPYAAGWMALALAGHGGVLVPRSVAAMSSPDDPVSPARRELLHAGILMVGAAVVASVTVPFRAFRAGYDTSGQDASPTPASPTPSPAATIPAGAISVAKLADVDRRGSKVFTVPFDAPAPLPAGDPAVVVRLASGSYVAFDTVCTHAGCTVEWQPTDAQLVCPCHGAVFDAANHGAVIEGPTTEPLVSLPIFVDVTSGSILLRV